MDSTGIGIIVGSVLAVITFIACLIVGPGECIVGCCTICCYPCKYYIEKKRDQPREMAEIKHTLIVPDKCANSCFGGCDRV